LIVDELEVMRLAGHSKYDTTLKYYLAVKDDLVDRAGKAVKHSVSREMLDRCLGSRSTCFLFGKSACHKKTVTCNYQI